MATRSTPLRQRWSTTTTTTTTTAATAAADAPAVLLLRREADALAHCRRRCRRDCSNGRWRVTYETGSLPASEPLLEEHWLAARANVLHSCTRGVGCCCCACAEVAHSVVPCVVLLCQSVSCSAHLFAGAVSCDSIHVELAYKVHSFSVYLLQSTTRCACTALQL
jgi:hypothetical protein